MKHQYNSIAWTGLSIRKAITILLVIIACGITIGFAYQEEQKDAQKPSEHNQKLRENYSPMSESKEIQKAYDQVRPKTNNHE